MKQMLVRGLAVGILLLPAVVFAAYNDVTITTDATLSVNDAEIDISGSSAVIQSVVVGATSFTVVLQPGSTFSVSAPGLNILSTDVSGTGVGVTPVCTGSASTLAIGAPDSGPTTVIIGVSSSLCSTSSSSSSSSGGGNGPPVSSGGGGGGGSYIPLTAPNTTPPASVPSSSGLSSTQVDAILSLLQSFGADQATIDNVKLAISGKATTGTITSAFARNLEVGMTGEDIKALQQWLNQNGYRIAETGPGSPGNETTKFGGATKAALIKFQKAHGITPAAGYFGPKTRAALGQ